MPSNTNGFSVRVPKIASQSKDAQLYNTLKDIVARTNEQLVQCASAEDLTLLVESLTELFADGDRGDITVGGEGMVWTINTAAVTDSKLRDSAGLSVIGQATNAAGMPTDIVAANDGEVLRRSGAALGFGQVATAGIADDAVTYAKLQNVAATDRLLGRFNSGAGNAEEIALGAGFSVAGGTLVFTGGKVMKALHYLSGTTTFTSGAGVTEIWVTGCGAGGGGGRGNLASWGGGGGGGGADSVCRARFVVTPSTGYSVVIGVGGAGSASASDGGAGGASSVGALVTLAGGAGGITSTTAAGGLGGVAGGHGGTNGTRGESYIATYETLPQGGLGGISYPGGYGAGGDGGQALGNGFDGNDGYILIEWNE